MTSPIRVLHIASGDLWAGAEAQAFTLMSHLERIPETEVAAILMNDGTLARKLRCVGIPVYIMDEQRNGALRVFNQVRKVLSEWRPDVVHTHRQKENILGSVANWSCQNVASVRTMHGLTGKSAGGGWRTVRQRALGGLDRWCARALQQKVIVVSGDLGERVREQLPPDKIAVIENGVDLAAIRAEKGVPEFRRAQPDCTHIGIAGRLVEVKRVDLFIETAAILRRESPQRRWRFHVFGDGPMLQTLQGLSQGAGMADVITFHGHRQDIAACIAGLDALVICSDHEGMPMIALEAVALGVPTVAHAVGGLPDVLPKDLLVFRHDAGGYKGAIMKAICEEGRMIMKIYATRCSDSFSAERNAERVRAVYAEAVAGRCAR